MATIETQIGCLLIVSLVIYLNLKKNKLYTKSRNAFNIILYSTFFSIIFDILSLVLIKVDINISTYWINTVCKCYLVTLIIFSFFILNYLMA